MLGIRIGFGSRVGTARVRSSSRADQCQTFWLVQRQGIVRVLEEHGRCRTDVTDETEPTVSTAPGLLRCNLPGMVALNVDM
jgi:hypothetical protein